MLSTFSRFFSPTEGFKLWIEPLLTGFGVKDAEDHIRYLMKNKAILMNQPRQESSRPDADSVTAGVTHGIRR